MTHDNGWRARIRGRVAAIYGRPVEDLECGILRLIEEYSYSIAMPPERPQSSDRWALTERDVVLITYGDLVRGPDVPPLAALDRFLSAEGWHERINTVHLLPFFPYSSDDGFSVIDYLEVDPALGNWPDVERIGTRFRLMFDLVLNHVSQQHVWFRSYLQGEAPYDRFFVDLDPQTDVSHVTRPRSHPLLTPFEPSAAQGGGTKYVWTTFSADQVDLNYREPLVLLRLLKVLLEYVRRGARIIRLDAVAYLWKDPTTSSIHLPQTHEVVKLMRDVAEAVAPDVLLLTETNVPHAENVSYFGAGDEAHMVYQFSLPPLLLDAYLNVDARVFSRWLADLSPPPAGAAYFNFTASHDGIGVRPLEGLVGQERIERLAEHARRCGGLVSLRRMPDGSERPYELNVTYVDALAPPIADVELHARRFLASQAIMLALAGVPAVYFHSLVGTQNDVAAARASGHARRINRRKFDEAELKRQIEATGSLQHRIYHGYRRLLQCRVQQPAFHPAAAQHVVDLGDPHVIAFLRTSLDGGQRILVLANLSGDQKRLDVSRHVSGPTVDMLGNVPNRRGHDVTLPPYQVAWLEDRRG